MASKIIDCLNCNGSGEVIYSEYAYMPGGGLIDTCPTCKGARVVEIWESDNV